MSRGDGFPVGRRHLALLILGFGVAFAPSPGGATESISYQGRLYEGSTAVTGVYDFEFKLYDRADFSTGVQVGPAALAEDAAVTDGLFTVELSFGTTPFTGADLWLQVGLRAGTSTGPYTVVDPRQKVGAAPFAILAVDAGRLGGLAAASYTLVGHAHVGGDIASGTVAEARLDSAIARDAEIMPAVLAGDGSGSGLDADSLDGLSSASFARSTRTAQAYGAVNHYFDELKTGSFNVTSVTWNDTSDRYEITITGMTFSSDDVAVVTTLGDAGSCPAGVIARAGSYMGKLLVYHVALDNSRVKCSFHFVVFNGF